MNHLSPPYAPLPFFADRFLRNRLRRVPFKLAANTASQFTGKIERAFQIGSHGSWRLDGSKGTCKVTRLALRSSALALLDVYRSIDHDEIHLPPVHALDPQNRLLATGWLPGSPPGDQPGDLALVGRTVGIMHNCKCSPKPWFFDIIKRFILLRAVRQARWRLPPRTARMIERLVSDAFKLLVTLAHEHCIEPTLVNFDTATSNFVLDTNYRCHLIDIEHLRFDYGWPLDLFTIRRETDRLGPEHRRQFDRGYAETKRTDNAENGLGVWPVIDTMRLLGKRLSLNRIDRTWIRQAIDQARDLLYDG